MAYSWRTPRRRVLWSYATATIGTWIALRLTSLVLSPQGQEPILLLFLIPIAFAAFLGGFLPGLAATVLSALAASYYLYPPLHSFAIDSPFHFIKCAALLGTGAVISFLLDSVKRAKKGSEEIEINRLLVPMERNVWWGFGAALALLGLIGGTAYMGVVKLRENDGWVDHTHQVISSLRRVQSLVIDAETGQRGYVITGDKSYLAPYDGARNRLGQEQETLRLLISDNEQQQESRRELDRLVSARLAQLANVLILRETQGISAAGAQILTGEGKRADQAIRELVARMEEREQKLLLERERRALRTSLISRGIIVLGNVVAFSMVGLALFLIRQDIAGSRRANAELQEAKANLEKRVEERTADLNASVEQLRLSRAQYAVTLASIGDGVITTDAFCRVTFLNEEAERLTGWSRTEALGELLVTIFPIINEDSRETIDDPAKKVLQEKRTVGLANHTVLMSRSGKEIPIADSGAPIRDAQGNVLGVVLVFRDCTAEREKETALRERVALQAQLAEVAESVPGAIFSFVQKPDGTCFFPYSNAAIEGVFGILPERLAEDGSGIFEAIHPDDRPEVLRYVEECQRTLAVWSGKYRVNHPRLGEIWVEGKAVPRKLPDGGLLWNGFLQDSTERRLTEEKAKSGEARLSAILHSALSGIITVDESQNIGFFNPAAEQMFGCRAAEAIGQPLDQFIPARYRAAHGNHIRKFGQTEIAGRQMGQREGIYGLRKNGEEFPVEASISHVEFAGKKIYTVILRDVTEEKKAEQELKQQASLLDLAPVMVRDLENRIVYWSHGAEKLYGYSREEAIGRVSHELLQTEAVLPIPMVDELLQQNGTWEGELLHRTADGGRVYAFSQWVLHRDTNGRPTRILEVNGDITARRHAEELQTRSQKLEALGTLAGGIAHDFNNMLLAINGNANLAMADLPDGHPALQSLTEIHKAGMRASELVKRILGFSRPQEQKKEVVQLQPVIEEALKLVRATLPARVQFRTQFAPNAPPVKVDANQIHQVVVNLATNAAHAIGERPGTIVVRLDAVHVHAEDMHGIPNLNEGHYVRLFVSDDGCGMDRATLNRIFDPFFTTKKQGEGTGLGLSVVHGIVSGHNGAISVTSQPAEGTAFHLFFPVAAEAPEHKPETRPEAPQHRSEHVLYVDDEESLVLLAKRMLERRGYQVSGFTDAVSALKEFRAHPKDFDVVVTDLSMPRMSGLEFTEELRLIRKEIPVVLTSGYLQPQDQEKAESLGIRELIQKPATAELLSGALERVLGEHATQT